MNPEIDHYLSDGCGRCAFGGTPQCKVNNWRKELKYLRAILLDCGLTEELKWSVPCYTFQKKNILILAAFKEYCAISFFKGALLQDAHSLLKKPGANTQAARLMSFTGMKEIQGVEPLIKSYTYEAIEIEKGGLQVAMNEKSNLHLTEEFLKRCLVQPELRTAFDALTPGKQRAYHLFFSAPKQSSTREARIEKCAKQILLGKGLHD